MVKHEYGQSGGTRARHNEMQWYSSGARKNSKRTWDFHVHTNPPVDRAFRTEYVEIPQADLAHARAYITSLLVARDAKLLAAPALGRVEVVDEVQVLVVDIHLGLLQFELVEQDVEVLVLSLRMRMVSR